MKIIMIRLPDGCLALSRERNIRRKDGRRCGSGASLEAWGWRAWRMRSSRILREFAFALFVLWDLNVGVGDRGGR